MKIIALDLNSLKTESIYKVENFEVLADFKMDSINKQKLIQIDITIKNEDPKKKYNYLSGNFCLKTKHPKLDLHAIELHIMEVRSPTAGGAYTIKPNVGEEIILKNGTTLVTSPVIYKNNTNPPVKKCYYPNYDDHPETKDGAIIVAI